MSFSWRALNKYKILTSTGQTLCPKTLPCPWSHFCYDHHLIFPNKIRQMRYFWLQCQMAQIWNHSLYIPHNLFHSHLCWVKSNQYVQIVCTRRIHILVFFVLYKYIILIFVVISCNRNTFGFLMKRCQFSNVFKMWRLINFPQGACKECALVYNLYLSNKSLFLIIFVVVNVRYRIMWIRCLSFLFWRAFYVILSSTMCRGAKFSQQFLTRNNALICISLKFRGIVMVGPKIFSLSSYSFTLITLTLYFFLSPLSKL